MSALTGPVSHPFAAERIWCRFQLASAQLPAAGLSGDILTWFDHGDGCFTAVVADVSGNGPGVAARADRLRALIDQLMPSRLSAGATLSALNLRLEPDAADGEFATALIAQFDASETTVRVASAGHLGPFLRSSGGLCPQLARPAGPALGIFATPTYGDALVSLRLGDTLVFATDGVTDAFRTASDVLGESIVRAHLAASDGDPASVCDRLIGRSALPGRGDATVLAVQLMGGWHPDDQGGVAVRQVEHPYPRV